MRWARAILLAALAVLAVPALVLAYDPRVAVKVETWSSDNGHGYVGVQTNGEWTPPVETTRRVRTTFYSEWENQGNPAAYCHAWWVWVHRTADDSTVNFDSPVSMVLCGPEPAIGISPSGFGDLSLYLEVGVDPVSAPARSERAVSAELTAGWRDYVDDAIAAFVRPDTVRVQRWTVDFGDGTRRTFPGDGTDRVVTTHSYEAGEFDVVITARVVGEAYGAFFTPEGVPFEEVVPFELDIRCPTDRRSAPTSRATPRSSGRAGCHATCSCARSSRRKGSCGLVASGSAVRRPASSATATSVATTIAQADRGRVRTTPRSRSGCSGTRPCPTAARIRSASS